MVEDVRQVIQDFLAPELRAITARLDSNEKVMEARFGALETQMNSRFKEVDSRFNSIEGQSNSRFNEISVRLQSLQETIDRSDSAQKLLIAKLTEDFQFDKRLTELERESRLNKSTTAA